MKNIDKIIAKLTPVEKQYLLEKLRNLILSNFSREVTTCPCCNGVNFKKNGFYKGVQKYKCLTTSKVFNYKTSSVVSGIKSLQKFEELLSLMVSNGFPTLDYIEKKLEISRQTAHDWRTKIMTAVYSEMKFDNQVIEFDETNFRLSRKGRKGMKYSRVRGKKLPGDNPYNVKVFMSYSRTTKKIDLFQSHMGRSSVQNLDNYLGRNEGIVVYSDSHPTYLGFYKQKKILHDVFLSKDHISLKDKKVHNQTLNYYGRKLQGFVNDDLHGVSTKYLQGYMNWFMFVENVKKESIELKDAVIDNKVALDIFKQKEREFQYFLKINRRNNYGKCRDRYYPVND